MDHAFGSQFTLGIEEELLLVDPATHQLAPVAERVLPAMDLPLELAGYEAYAAELELRSPPCAHAGEAVEALARVRDTARAAGGTLMGVGVHPAGALGDAQLVGEARYQQVLETMRGLIQRTPECALHVHVGMPDSETAIRVHNALRNHLPLLVGLSANSPWWFGADSGLASARYALVRAYPRRGVPRAFRDFEDFAATAAAATAAGGLDDYTFLWWDVRPHPKLGTVEVREMDAQGPLRRIAALAGLIHALARGAAEDPGEESAPSEALSESCFVASRDGLDAMILHRGAVMPLREAARDVLARARPAARELGEEEAVAGVESILREGGGADRQRAAHARGGIDELLGMLVRETDGAKAFAGSLGERAGAG
jgi:glutamate---cysteine ligase / carboxylate-amine ligase